MPKFRMLVVKSGEEYTLDCAVELLAARKVGRGPVAVGDRFRRVSKLDGSAIIEKLLKIDAPRINVDDLRALHNGTWPMRSDTLAIDPDQYVEAMEADAELGVPIQYDQQTGEAIFTSPGQFRRFCEAHGYYARNGGYQDPKRLDQRERETRGLPAVGVPGNPWQEQLRAA